MPDTTEKFTDSQTLDDNESSAIVRHVKATYAEMLTQSSPRTLASLGVEGDTSTQTVMVYEGKLTKLITQDLNLSVPYYTKIMQTLKRLGCVEQLKRGGGNSGSMWALLHEPSDELFARLAPDTPRKANPVTQLRQETQQQISSLNNRVTVLEEALAGMIEASR